MKAEDIIGRTREDVAAALLALGINRGDQPTVLPRALGEILEGQDMVLELNESYVNNTLKIVRSKEYIELSTAYFKNLIENFYMITEENWKKHTLRCYNKGLLESIGWARFLVFDGIEGFLDEAKHGFPKGQNILESNYTSIHSWMEKEGFVDDAEGFVNMQKERFQQERDEEHDAERFFHEKEIFFLSGFIEAVQKTEENLREDFEKAGLLFPNPNEEPTLYTGGKPYDGYTVVCPLFSHVGSLSYGIINGSHYWLKTTDRGG